MEINSNKLEEDKRKLKDSIIRYFNQLKSGCYRDLCYNKYCFKSKHINLNNDADIVSLAVQLEKKPTNSFCLDLNENSKIIQYDPNTNNLEINLKFESLCLNFLKNDLSKFDSAVSMYENGINFDYMKLKAYFNEYKKKYQKFDEIDFFVDNLRSNQLIVNIFESNDEEKITSKVYLFFILSRMLIYVSLHPYFGFEGYYAKSGIENFFEIYLLILKKVKKLKINWINIFNDLNKEMMIDIINAYQSFISIFFMMENNKNSFIKIKNPVKILNIFFQVNDKFKTVPYTEFYNDSLNTNDELKYIIIKSFKNYKKHDKKFCLLTYHWLFDSAFKRDVLSELNAFKQKQEMINSITSGMHSFDNIMNIESSIYLCIEIKRNNMIEDTLNIISNSNINFKKGLRVILIFFYKRLNSLVSKESIKEV